jgi:DUF1680 family protein
MRRTGDLRAQRKSVRNAGDAAALLAHLTEEAQENVYYIATDRAGRVLEVHSYSRGTSVSSQLKTIEGVGHLLNRPEVDTVYFVHNHPGDEITATTLKASSDNDLPVARELKDYLDLAKFFLDIRGDSSTHPLYGAYNQDHLPVVSQEEAVGHAVRAVYMYAGMTDIAALYQDDSYLKAVHTLWDNVVNKKMYITGGIGARHEGESFGDNYELPGLTAYNETCAAIGNVQWNHRMFLLTGEAKYYDIIERSLFNGLISGISLDGTTFFYPNPLESDGQYKFNHGACTRSSWFDCSCCPTNLIRFIPSIPNLVYATQEDIVFINLYMSNEALLNVHNTPLLLTQQSGMPWQGSTRISVKPEKSMWFTIKLRIPGWAKNEVLPSDLYHYTDTVTDRYDLLLNGEPVSGEPTEDGYVSISRNWHTGDEIVISFPMSVRRVKANEKANLTGMVAIEHGPMVYCIEEIDNPNFDTLVLDENSVITTNWEPDLLGGVNVLVSPGFKAIPYYAWSNRGVGKMKVWLNNH